MNYSPLFAEGSTTFTKQSIANFKQVNSKAMNTIKTNYTTDIKMVLSGNNCEVVAIINVVKGSDITEQVKLAIKEHLISDRVDFDKSLVLESRTSSFSIDFHYSDEGEVFSDCFELVMTAEY